MGMYRLVLSTFLTGGDEAMDGEYDHILIAHVPDGGLGEWVSIVTRDLAIQSRFSCICNTSSLAKDSTKLQFPTF